MENKTDFISLKDFVKGTMLPGVQTVIFLYATPNLWDRRRFICSSA